MAKFTTLLWNELFAAVGNLEYKYQRMIYNLIKITLKFYNEYKEFNINLNEYKTDEIFISVIADQNNFLKELSDESLGNSLLLSSGKKCECDLFDEFVMLEDLTFPCQDSIRLLIINVFEFYKTLEDKFGKDNAVKLFESCFYASEKKCKEKCYELLNDIEKEENHGKIR